MGPNIVDSEGIEAWFQCERRAWLRLHAPERAARDDGLARFLALQRSDLRRLLARRFGSSIGAATRGTDPAARSLRTRDAVERGDEIVADATFEATPESASGGSGARLRASVAILERRNGGWNAFALAAGSHVREHHVRRLALAAEAAARNGLRIDHTTVLHLDRRPAGRRSDLVATNVDARVEHQRRRLPAYLTAVAATLASGVEPRTSVGSHCRRPRPCPFQDHCRSTLAGRSVDQVWGLRVATRQALRSAGWVELSGVPDEVPGLTSAEDEALADARSERARLDHEGLRTALARLRTPIAFLDVEFATPAVPWVAGMDPFEPLPFQFSLDVEGAAGALHHREALELDADADPRPALASSLATALEGTGSIVVYDASSEAKLLASLVDFQPALADAVERLWDLQEVVMRCVRHPGFEARWDLKRVAGTLARGSYHGVEVRNGLAAQTSWRRLLVRPDRSVERALRSYCAADSRAMVDVLAALRRWTASGVPPR